MTSYRVMYQTRRKGSVSIHHGDWQDKECVVVAGEDARDAIDEIVNDVVFYDFRLRGVEIIGQVDVVIGAKHEASN